MLEKQDAFFFFFLFLCASSPCSSPLRPPPDEPPGFFPCILPLPAAAAAALPLAPGVGAAAGRGCVLSPPRARAGRPRPAGAGEVEAQLLAAAAIAPFLLLLLLRPPLASSSGSGCANHRGSSRRPRTPAAAIAGFPSPAGRACSRLPRLSPGARPLDGAAGPGAPPRTLRGTAGGTGGAETGSGGSPAGRGPVPRPRGAGAEGRGCFYEERRHRVPRKGLRRSLASARLFLSTDVVLWGLGRCQRSEPLEASAACRPLLQNGLRPKAERGTGSTARTKFYSSGGSRMDHQSPPATESRQLAARSQRPQQRAVCSPPSAQSPRDDAVAAGARGKQLATGLLWSPPLP